MSATKIPIEATIAANTKKVWDLWNKPEHITKWNFAIDTWHCPKASNDLRVGGKTKIVTVFEAESENPVEMQKGGWQSILDSFKKYAEAN